MDTKTQLRQVFCDNFIAYYRSHAAHINIVGRNFEGDHALLGGIYEARQGEIDTIGEIIRTCGDFVPNAITVILGCSDIADLPMEGSADQMLEEVRGDLERLVRSYEMLNEVADEEEMDHIANYAQEQITALNKNLWMLDSTLA